jgi:hypothetical protein
MQNDEVRFFRFILSSQFIYIPHSPHYRSSFSKADNAPELEKLGGMTVLMTGTYCRVFEAFGWRRTSNIILSRPMFITMVCSLRLYTYLDV